MTAHPAALFALLACAACPLLALAAEPLVMTQQNRAFSAKEASVPRNGVVRFVNADDYPHQISVTGPGMAYDSDLQQPGQDIQIPFPTQGTFEVRCGIHPRMRLTVHVETRP